MTDTGGPLEGISRLFIDTAPVIYFVERHPQYVAAVSAVVALIDDGVIHAVTSPITLAECLVGPLRRGDTAAYATFTDVVAHGRNATFCPTDEAIADRAARVRSQHQVALADALQVATCMAMSCDALFTNDVRLNRISGVRVVTLAEVMAHLSGTISA